MNEDGTDGEGYTRGGDGDHPSSWDQVPPMMLQVEEGSVGEIETAIQRGLEPEPVVVDADGNQYRVRLYLDEAATPLHWSSAMPRSYLEFWYPEFAHVRAAAWRDNDRREDVRQEESPEQPAFSVGDRVVFKGSDPILRREWRVEALDKIPPHIFAPWGQPVTTCTIRRGSTVKTGVSLGRLELVVPE